MQHRHEPLPDPRQINPHLPADIVPVLQKALAKDPDQRFQSAQELGRAIQEISPDPITVLISDSSPQGQNFDRSTRQDQMRTLPIFDTGATQQMTTNLPVGPLPSRPGGVTSQPHYDSGRRAAGATGDSSRADGSL